MYTSKSSIYSILFRSSEYASYASNTISEAKKIETVPAKPSRFLGKMDNTVQFESGRKMTEYKNFAFNPENDSLASSAVISDSEMTDGEYDIEKNDRETAEFQIVTPGVNLTPGSEDKATYMSETDELYRNYPPSLTRTQPSREFNQSIRRPRSNTSTLSPTGKNFLIIT